MGSKRVKQGVCGRMHFPKLATTVHPHVSLTVWYWYSSHWAYQWSQYPFLLNRDGLQWLPWPAKYGRSYGLWLLRLDLKLPCPSALSLGIRVLGTQPPCCEGAQATRSGLCRCSARAPAEVPTKRQHQPPVVRLRKHQDDFSSQPPANYNCVRDKWQPPSWAQSASRITRDNKMIAVTNWKRRSKTVTVCRWHDTIHRES